FWVDGGPGFNYDTYILTFPPSEIAYNFSVAPPSNPPHNPIIQGPDKGNTEEIVEFQVSASDPDNDNIRYGVDWNNDGSIDQWYPSSGAVESGTEKTINYQWITSGHKTFQVVAEDVHGARSPWASHEIEIIECASCAYKQCYGGKVYCYDSCWNREGAFDDCIKDGVKGICSCVNSNTEGKCIDAQCVYDGVCGSADSEGQSFCDKPPRENLCEVTFQDTVVIYEDAGGDKSNDMFKWKCFGDEGFSDADCSAERDCRIHIQRQQETSP
ncbi:MAG: hypothetical protein R6V40_04085, partial [Candidatus Moraniibacteriota bacterium]